MGKPATTKRSPAFIPHGTKDETEAFVLYISYLRHNVFTTNRYFANGKSEPWAWNVTEGYKLAQERGGSLSTFDAAEHGIDLVHILMRYETLDVRYAINEADLSKPLLLVPASEMIRSEKVETMLLIDGWHRLFRSVVESLETGEPRPLPAYFLTEDEARAVQITPETAAGGIPIQPGTLTLRQLSRQTSRFSK